MPLQIVRNDITKMKADAIVNTANPEPICAGGTDSAVYEAAGKELLLSARQKIGSLKAGQAAVTPAFRLDARYIIHTVGPIWKGGWRGETKMLRACYTNSLSLALQYHCKSIAFPLISTGIYGFPKEKGLQIALSSINKFLMKHEMQVYLVVFDQQSFQLSGRLFHEIDSFVSKHYVKEQLKEEYTSEDDSRILTSASLEHSSRIPTDARSEQNPRTPVNAILKHDSGIPANTISEDNSRILADARLCHTGALPVLTEDRFQESEPAFSESASSFQEYEKLPCAFPRSARSLDDIINNAGETFQERLLRFIDERNLTNAQVYKKANLSRKLFSKILCNPDYQPKKRTVIAFAISLQLNLDDTKDLMSRAGFALSPSSKFDLVIEYFIEKKIYDIYTINTALFNYGLPMLGE